VKYSFEVMFGNFWSWTLYHVFWSIRRFGKFFYCGYNWM